MTNGVVTLRNYIERHRLWTSILARHPERREGLQTKIAEADAAIIAITTSDIYLQRPTFELTLDDIK